MVATAKKPVKEAATESSTATKIDPVAHVAQIKKAYQEMRSVHLRMSRFRQQVRYQKSAKEKMAEAIQGTNKGLRSTSKPLCDTSNPWVEAFWKKCREMHQYYESMTEPRLSQVCDDDGQPMVTVDGDPVLRPVKGVRLIKYDRWPEFRDELLKKFEAVKQAARDMDTHRSSIYETDKKIIGEAQFNPNDYDSSFANSVRLDELWLSCEKVDALLPAHERKQHAQDMLTRFNEIITSACLKRGNQLEEMFSNLARALGREQICQPDPEGPYSQYQGAVLVPYRYRDHSKDADIPVGKVRVCVRQQVPDQNAGKKRNVGWTTVESYIDTPMSPEEIKKYLRPGDGDKRNRLDSGLIANVVNVVNEIRGAFVDLAGPHAKAYEAHLEKIYSLINKLGGDTESLDAAFRDKQHGEENRDKFADALQEALPKIASQAVEAVKVSRTVTLVDIDLD